MRLTDNDAQQRSSDRDVIAKYKYKIQIIAAVER